MPAPITLRFINGNTFAAVAGATVSLTSTNYARSGTTDASGYVTFTGEDLIVDPVALVEASGYKSQVFHTSDGSTHAIYPGSGWQNTTGNTVILPSGAAFLEYQYARSGFSPYNNVASGSFEWDFEITLEDLVNGGSSTYTVRAWGAGDGSSVIIPHAFKQSYYKWTMTVLNDLHAPPPLPQTNYGFCYVSNSFPVSVGLFIFNLTSSASIPDPPEPPPALGKALTVAYTPLRHRLRGFITADALSVERFDDAWTPAVAATVSVEASGVSGHDLLWRPDSVGEVVYAKSGTVYGRYSRDQGRSWSVADSIGTGDDACQAIDYRRGLKLVGLYDEASETWSIVVGTQDSDGEWGTWTSPASLVTGAQPSAALTIRPDGIAEFDYTTSGGTRTTLRCRSFSSTSTGTWS